MKRIYGNCQTIDGSKGKKQGDASGFQEQGKRLEGN